MAHWAEIDETGVVLRVLVGSNEEADEGYGWLVDSLGGTWLQTSYNTRGGVHYDPATGKPSKDQSKAFRGNYAGIGYTYHEALDAFISPQPYPSWVLNEETFSWDAPTPYPTDGAIYTWDEEAVAWLEVEDV
jgi:hypothetical protein